MPETRESDSVAAWTITEVRGQDGATAAGRPGPQIDRFELGARLGSGGMGTVYEAWDAKLQRRVALKFLHRSGEGPASERRLVREAQGLAQLSHPNVIPVYDVGQHEGRVWIAMEYVAGQTLRAWIDSGKRSRAEILERWIAAGRGLAAVHAAGLVHRDIKPDNVLLGDDGRVRIIDFGLVKIDERSITSRGQPTPLDRAHEKTTESDAFLGTPAYAAPEQREQHWVDARSDQYAYCVSLWEALTGSRPHRIERQRGGLVPLPPHARLPAQLHRALSRGLSPDHDARFDDMIQLLAALQPTRRRWLAPAVIGSGATALAIAIGSAVLVEPPAEPPAELGAEDRQLDGERRDIDDAASIQTGLQSTLEANQGHGAAAMDLALEAALPYRGDSSSMPTPVLQALFDMQSVDVIVESAIIYSEAGFEQITFSPSGEHLVGLDANHAQVWDLLGQPLASLDGHVPEGVETAAVSAIRLSPTGVPTAVYTSDDYARVWTETGELLFSPSTGPVEVGDVWRSWPSSVVSLAAILWPWGMTVAISPDGRSIVYRDPGTEALRLWPIDGRSGVEILDSDRGRLVAAFSADSTRVVLSSGRDPLSVCNASAEVLARSSDEPQTTWAIAVSADGSRIVTGHETHSAVLRDHEARPVASLDGHTSSVMAVAFSHDGKRLATGSQDHTIRVWDASGALTAILEGHGARIRGLAFSPDDSLLASTADDRTTRIWTIHRPLSSLRDHGLEDAAAVQFSPDGSLLATTTPGALWGVDGQRIAELPGGADHIQFAPDSSLVAFVDDSRAVQLWSRSGRHLATLETQIVPTGKTSFRFSPDGSRLLVNGNSDRYCVWSSVGTCLAELPIAAGSRTTGFFLPEDRRVLTYVASERSARIWTDRGELVAELGSRYPPQLSPTGQILSFNVGLARLHDAAGETIAELPMDASEPPHVAITPVASFSADGEFVAIAPPAGGVHIWTLDGTPVATLAQATTASSLALSKDGSRIAIGGDSGELWTLDGRLLASLEGHANYIVQARFSPDGDLLITRSSDTVRIWEASSGRLLADLRPERRTTDVSFSPDGSAIAISGTPSQIFRMPDQAVRRACEILDDHGEYDCVTETCDGE